MRSLSPVPHVFLLCGCILLACGEDSEPGSASDGATVTSSGDGPGPMTTSSGSTAQPTTAPMDPTTLPPDDFTTASSTSSVTTGDPSGDGTGDSGDPGSTSLPPSPDDCTPADDACEDDTLVTCVGGELHETLCGQTWCAQHGLGNALGCGYVNGAPQCMCEEALECYPGESACVAADSAQECIDGKWSGTISCDTFCVQQAYDLSLSCTQLGKTAVCDCRWECNPGQDTFLCSQNGLGIFECEDVGAWSPYYDCDEVCVYNGYSGSVGCQWFQNDAQFKCACY